MNCLEELHDHKFKSVSKYGSTPSNTYFYLAGRFFIAACIMDGGLERSNLESSPIR